MTAPRAPLTHRFIPDPRRGSERRERAACLDADPELFYPPDEEGHRKPGWSPGPAIAVCRRCPVVPQCRQEARDFEGSAENKAQGVWGGVGPGPRVAEMRARRVMGAGSKPDEVDA